MPSKRRGRRGEKLAKVQLQRGKAIAGAIKPDLKTTKGLITKLAYWLEKEGLPDLWISPSHMAARETGDEPS